MSLVISESFEILRKDVELAASVLDITKPNWFNEVDTETLDMQCNCIMDQIYGRNHFMSGLLEVEEYGYNQLKNNTNICGMWAFGNDNDVKQFWVEEINKRKEIL